MAWTLDLELADGTTLASLHDETNYAVRDFAAPTPGRRRDWAGQGNLFRSGAMLRGEAFDNRVVRLDLRVLGGTSDSLAANVQTIEDALRRARDASAWGLGERVRLKYVPDGMTTTLFFEVLTGSFDPIGEGSHAPGSMFPLHKQLLDRRLLLVCEPFAVTAQETVSNSVRDPSFEVAGTALADWTENITATGTTSRDTSQAKYGDASLKLDMTNSSASGEVVERTQVLTGVDAGETWSFGAWFRVTALSSCKAVLVALYNDGGATESTVEITSTNSAFAQITLENETVPAGATQVTLKVRLEATAGSATGTAYVDGLMGIEASALPTTWMSGSEVRNHFDDDGQLHLNYVDLYGVPGDYPAKIQVKAVEQEAHTALWLGARHAGRLADAGIWHEGEAFEDGGENSLPATADGNASNGNYTEVELTAQVDAASSTGGGSGTNPTHDHTVGDIDNGYLLVWVTRVDNDGTVSRFPTGVTYGGVAMASPHSRAIDTNTGVSIWELVSPATGTNTISVTFPDAGTATHIMAISFKGVHQATPRRTFNAGASGTGQTVTVDVDSVAGDLVVGGVGTNSNTSGTAGSGETEQIDNGQGMAYTERASTTTTTISPTLAASVDWGIIAVSVKPAGSQPSDPAIFTKALTSPPRGAFRVLARVSEQGTAPDIRAAIGYGFGNVTADASVENDYVAVDGSAFHIIDLGLIPDVEPPENATIGTLTLRLAVYSAETSNWDDSLRIDWVMLLPVDMGALILTKDSAQDTVLIDGMSEVRQAVITDGSDVVQSIPASQSGEPPQAHPLGTRIYLVANDNTSARIIDEWNVVVTVSGRFLSLAGV